MNNQSLLTLLSELEAELKAQSLWSTAAPSEQQLASPVPFAADVMPFEHWLQFIFSIRLTHLIQHNLPMPQAMSITPMAEITFGHKFPDLLNILRKIDALFQEPKE